jgi:hypothetical protein
MTADAMTMMMMIVAGASNEANTCVIGVIMIVSGFASIGTRATMTGGVTAEIGMTTTTRKIVARNIAVIAIMTMTTINQRVSPHLRSGVFTTPLRVLTSKNQPLSLS